MSEYSQDMFADDSQQGSEAIVVYPDLLQEDVPEAMHSKQSSKPESRTHGPAPKTKVQSTKEMTDVMEDDDVE